MNSATTTKIPAAGPAAFHGNAWLAAAVGIGGVSNIIDTQSGAEVSIFGNASVATNITVQVSQDGTNFYNYAAAFAANGNFHQQVLTGARYIRLSSSAAATITATIAPKI